MSTYINNCYLASSSIYVQQLRRGGNRATWPLLNRCRWQSNQHFNSLKPSYAVCSATDGRSPLEVLRQENQLLKETIASAENDTAALESQLSAGTTLLLIYK